jgi:N6-L-threonylcarbamoyladenine synthase
MKPKLVLGIESSCDETSAAVLAGEREILSNVIHSQVDVHREWGGVVPELASRHHAEQIDVIVSLALQKADVPLSEIELIAVTAGPGLVGALLVGMAAAKGISLSTGIPIVGVDHIQAHIHSVELAEGEMEYPALSLVVSGGHTNLFYQPSRFEYQLIARTRDDAAGEAYDKVAKLLGLGYPGGPVIDRLAAKGDPKGIRFSPVKMSDGSLDFSFSGLKTAVRMHVEKSAELGSDSKPEENQALLDLVASFQFSVVRELINRVQRAVTLYDVRSIGISGGVSMNRALRQAVAQLSDEVGVPAYLPQPALTGDNAAMIAYLGRYVSENGPAWPITFNADPNLRLAANDGKRRHPRSG